MERVHEVGEGSPGLTRTAKITVASFAVALAFTVGFGSVKAWHNLVTLPRTYDAMRDRCSSGMIPEQPSDSREESATSRVVPLVGLAH
jgi:hypothetical protein